MTNKSAVDVTTIRNGKVRCVGFNRDERYFTKNKVYEVVDGRITNDRGFTYTGGNAMRFLKPWYEFEPVDSEKIVITHDGKTTTTTKYFADGSKVTATARCAPEDEFNFETGAKLALERLTEKTVPPVEWRVVDRKAKVGDYIRLKTNGGFDFSKPGDILKVDAVSRPGGTRVRVYGRNHPRDTEHPNELWNYFGSEYEVVEKVDTVTVNGFKVGDRVNYNGVNGTIICISRDNSLGVEFDKPTEICHNCNSVDLKAGTTGTKSTSRWLAARHLNHGELPVYYNGKVVCVKLDPHERDLTVGKVYNIVDGQFKDDKGDNRPSRVVGKISTPDDLTNFKWWENKFIPIVE